jgi:hypothetical protein
VKIARDRTERRSIPLKRCVQTENSRASWSLAERRVANRSMDGMLKHAREPKPQGADMSMTGSTTWVVYQSVQGKAMGAKSICEQREWEALERSHPGANELLASGLASESQAEKLARGTSGDVKKRAVANRKISRFQNEPIEDEAEAA